MFKTQKSGLSGRQIYKILARIQNTPKGGGFAAMDERLDRATLAEKVKAALASGGPRDLEDGMEVSLSYVARLQDLTVNLTEKLARFQEDYDASASQLMTMLASEIKTRVEAERATILYDREWFINTLYSDKVQRDLVCMLIPTVERLNVPPNPVWFRIRNGEIVEDLETVDAPSVEEEIPDTDMEVGDYAPQNVRVFAQ